jgi:succinate-semialdehyde dehydrogenase/glutarate-semialdehyde dehydrogenase
MTGAGPPFEGPLRQRVADKALLEPVALVGGEMLGSAQSCSTFRVTNPSDGSLLTVLPDCGVAEARRAIDAACRAQRAWAGRTGKDRAAVLRRLYDLMVTHSEDLATILTAEMGKPLAEARGEIAYGASFIEWFAEEAKRVYGDTIPGHEEDKRLLVLRQPVGVVAAITPWNFPNAMITRKIGPALAAGCAVVLKPAAQTPMSAIAIGLLARRAGLPDGLLSILPSTASADLGREFAANPKVRKITFTGSTEVGRILMRQGADQIKKLSLELGGNAPFIVFDDADLDDAVEGAIAAKFRNAGQTCVCANRIYVQEGIYDAFAERFVSAVARLSVGDGFDRGVTIGPLIDGAAVDKVEEHLRDAVAHGATLLAGGRRAAAGSLFFVPTVLSDATPAMRIAHEEIFGPVAPLFRFQTEEEVIEHANATEFGLAAYFYGRDLSRVWRVAEALEYGIVGVNTGRISTEVAPFGGIKQSGTGREGSRYGIDDYLERKYVCMAI